MNMLKTFIVFSLFSTLYSAENGLQMQIVAAPSASEPKAPLAKRPSNEGLKPRAKKVATSERVINADLQKTFRTQLHSLLPTDHTPAATIEKLQAQQFVEVKFTPYYTQTAGDEKHRLCKICNATIHANEISSHILSHGNILFTCPIVGCHKQFKKKDTFKQHLATQASKDPQIASTSSETIKAHQEIYNTFTAALVLARTKQSIRKSVAPTVGSAYLSFAIPISDE